MQLDGKIALITGASSGIGSAAARLFAQAGAKLVLGARRADLLQQMVDQIGAAGGQAVCEAGDVRDEAYHRALTDLAAARFGGLDVAFNNAGCLGDLGPATEMTHDNWRMVIDTNLTSAFLGARQQIPLLLARGGGSLIFTSSFVGHTIGLPGMAAYAASKAGMVGLTQVLAVEHGAAGLRVNALLPGGTDTPAADSFGSDPAVKEFVRSIHALKRIAEPEEIAQAALFLASDASSFVTGSAMLVDGGNSVSKT